MPGTDLKKQIATFGPEESLRRVRAINRQRMGPGEHIPKLLQANRCFSISERTTGTPSHQMQ
jgi:hypothetical protein